MYLNMRHITNLHVFCFDAFCSAPHKKTRSVFGNPEYTVLHLFSCIYLFVCFLCHFFFSQKNCEFLEGKRAGSWQKYEGGHCLYCFTSPFLFFLRKPPTVEGLPAVMFLQDFIWTLIPLSAFFFPALLRSWMGKIILTSCETRSDFQILLVERSWFKYILL